jgi:hypothetical protein
MDRQFVDFRSSFLSTFSVAVAVVGVVINVFVVVLWKNESLMHPQPRIKKKEE